MAQTIPQHLSEKKKRSLELFRVLPVQVNGVSEAPDYQPLFGHEACCQFSLWRGYIVVSAMQKPLFIEKIFIYKFQANPLCYIEGGQAG